MAKRSSKIVFKPRYKSAIARKRASRQSYQIGPLKQNWPILPKVSPAQAMAIFSQMQFIERIPAETQERLQLRQIERVLRHAHETIPFYLQRIDGIEQILDGEMDESFFSSLPILTRSEIQTAGTRLHSTRPPTEHGRVYLQRTSGSTGKPIEVASTGLRKIMSAAHTLRAYYWHKLDITQKYVSVRTAF